MTTNTKTYLYVSAATSHEDYTCIYEMDVYKDVLLKLYKDKVEFSHFISKFTVNQARSGTIFFDMELSYMFDESVDLDDDCDKYVYTINGDYISSEEFLEIANDLSSHFV